MIVQDELRGLLLHHGPSPVVESFIAKERFQLDLSSILEETFRRIDLGPRETVCHQSAYVSAEVEFLFRHGAIFGENCDLNKLLEDTYRYIELGPLEFKRRAGARLSPEVDFLLMQGASFNRVPCGLPQLVDDTVQYLHQSDQNRDNFLFKQATHSKIHSGWYYFLHNVYESLFRSVNSETLCHIVGLISQQKDFKIHALPFKSCWPQNPNVGKHLMDACLAELQQRSDKVTIRAEGREITTFRNILQARSPYFEKLFNDNLEESSFEIGGFYVTIELVVKYARFPPTDVGLGQKFQPSDSWELTENTLNELINILHAANTFEMADLFGEVEQHIVIHGKGFISAKNVQEVKVIADEVNAVHLERYCNAFIATNLRAFTFFPSLPTELRMSIWRQLASRPRLLTPSKKGLELPPHIAVFSGVCRQSDSEMQRVWGKPRIDGINFEFDIIWLDMYSPSLPRSLGCSRKARYCATPAPYPRLDNMWESRISEIIHSCPCLEVLYLLTVVPTDSDEFEYCQRLTNREPTTLVEARRWIEESAHQRLQKDLPNGYILPQIMLIDENKLSRLTAASEQ